MEALLFIMDACVIIVVVFFSLKNDTLRPGGRQIGLFRTTEGDPAELTDRRQPVQRRRPGPGLP